LSNGAVLHHVCSTSSWLTGSHPTVTVCVEITDQRAVANRTSFDPNAIKWSLTIDNYPYSVPNSNLALKVSFDSRATIKEFDATDESEYNTTTSENAIDLGGDDSIKAKAIAAYQKNILQNTNYIGDSAAILYQPMIIGWYSIATESPI
jgi:hypothetical protein